MSDIFEAAFGAAKASIQKSAEVPLSDFPAQSTIAQATTINAGNAALAAIEDNRAVQEQYANNADTIRLATAEATSATAASAVEIAKKGIQAVQLGRDSLVQESVSAMQKQKELSAVQANKPNALLHPIDWVADTLHEKKLEGAIKDHSVAVQNYTRNINSVVQNTTVQVEELLEIDNLTKSSSLRLQAEQLNRGLAAQAINAQAETSKADKVKEIGGDIFSEAQARAQWAINDLNAKTGAANAANSKRANELQAEDMQRKADAAKYREGAIKQAAMFWLTQQNDGKGLPATPANMNMAIQHMTKLEALPNSEEFALYSKGGALAINSSDPKSATSVAVQGMTIGEVAKLGAYTKNSSLAAIGGNQVNQLTQQYEQELRNSSYKATLPAGAEVTQADFDLWQKSLNAKQNSDFRARARAMAENVVYNQSVGSYAKGRTEGKDIGQGAINLVAFKTAPSLMQVYGIDKKAASVLSDPKAQMFISHAGAGSTQDKKTAQLIAIMEVLEKNGIKNPANVAALIGKKTGEAMLDSDTETATLAGYGVVAEGSGTITYKGEKYRLGNPVDMDRMRQVATGRLKPSALGITAAAVNALAPSQSAADIEAAKNLVKFPRGISLQATPEQAALTASKYTPAGHAPQVSGGVPATALTEADKVYAEVGAKLDAADVAYEQASQQIEQKNTRAYTDALFAEVRAAEAAKPPKQAGLTVDLPLDVISLPEHTAPELSNAFATSPTQLKNTDKAVDIVEEAIRDGSLPKKQAVPAIKQKVQEAKKADKPEAASKWDKLLDMLKAPPPEKGSLSIDLSK